MLAPGNNKDTRIVALHTGVLGDVGLAMMLTALPQVTFKLERIHGGATAMAAKKIIQSKLRLPSTLEQFLHGGEIVKPREVVGFENVVVPPDPSPEDEYNSHSGSAGTGRVLTASKPGETPSANDKGGPHRRKGRDDWTKGKLLALTLHRVDHLDP